MNKDTKIEKGDLGGECYRNACKNSNARWFNHSTQMHYCSQCADNLNNDEYNKRDAMRLYGHDLCTFVFQSINYQK